MEFYCNSLSASKKNEQSFFRTIKRNIEKLLKHNEVLLFWNARKDKKVDSLGIR